MKRINFSCRSAVGRTPKVVRAVMFALFFAIFAFTSEADARQEYEWWNKGSVTSIGYGINSDGTKPGDAGKRARDDARRKLSEKIASIRVTAWQTAGETSAAAASDLAVSVNERTDANGSVSVSLSLPLYGEDSLSSVLLTPWESKASPSPAKNQSGAGGGYTSLVIDCTEWEDKNDTALDPVLMPCVRDEAGRTIYGHEYAGYDTAVKKGIVLYAADSRTEMAGSRPLVIRVASLADESGTPIVSCADAEKILLENTYTHFLEDAAVVIVSRSIDPDASDERGGSWGVRDSDVFA